MKYTFTCKDECGGDVTHTFYAETHYEIAERFNDFLQGCGFKFNEGQYYDLVSEETEPFEGEEHDVMSWTSDALYRGGLPENTTLYKIREPGAHLGNVNVSVGDWDVQVPSCPKCKIPQGVMCGFECFDNQCGMKK